MSTQGFLSTQRCWLEGVLRARAMCSMMRPLHAERPAWPFPLTSICSPGMLQSPPCMWRRAACMLPALTGLPACGCAQSLRHVNIVQFLGAALAGDQIMLVTEYMPRGDLWRALSQDSASHFAWRSTCGSAHPVPAPFAAQPFPWAPCFPA